jgi:hypothetical protein
MPYIADLTAAHKSRIPGFNKFAEAVIPAFGFGVEVFHKLLFKVDH